jgi:DNA modification methylase
MPKEIIVKQLKDLKGNPANPRKITDEQLEMLKASLEEFGDLSGFVYNRRTKQLIGAHQRAQVSPKDAQIYIDRKHDEPTKTGTVAEGWIEINGERHKYREVDVDEQREKAMNIAANKHGGEFDMPKLTEWLLELDQHNYDLGVVGFTAEELENIMAPVHGNEGLTDPDAVPEVPKEAKTKRGELWILGNHRVLCGDATDKADVERLMAGEKADMVFTDPPYGIDLDTDWGKRDGNAKIPDGRTVKRHSYMRVTGDAVAFNPESLLETFKDVPEMFLWGANYYLKGTPDNSWVCWDKKLTESGDKNVIGDFELCWSKKRHKNTMIRCVWHGPFGHIKSLDGDNRVHPTQKPVKLCIEFANRWSEPNAKVVDVFLGSGSTLIACEKTQRRCFGMEIEPLYIDVILDRWAKFTGKDPVREDGLQWSELCHSAQ